MSVGGRARRQTGGQKPSGKPFRIVRPAANPGSTSRVENEGKCPHAMEFKGQVKMDGRFIDHYHCRMCNTDFYYESTER